MMTLTLVVKENYISVVITHSAAFHNVPIGETLYLCIIMDYQTEGYRICQCILQVAIHIGEPKTCLFIYKYAQMENINTYTKKVA